MTKFDREVKETFNRLEVECHPSFENIKLSDMGHRSNDNIEFDFIGRIGNVGLLIEVTTEKKNQRMAIQKFVRHSELFVKSSINIKQKMHLFLPNLISNKLASFESVDTWKYIYIGTSDEIIKDLLDEKLEPGKPLFVINSEHYQYLEFLSKTIGRFAKYDFFKRLGITHKETGEEETEINVEALRLRGKAISKVSGLVDLFVFTIKASSLLKIARVMRYSSLDSWIPEVGSNYQRLLNVQKLNKIRSFLKQELSSSAFPNAIIVVLPNTVKYDKNEKKLRITKEYSSVEIIDGQHRLFAFSDKNIPDTALESIDLIVVGVKFQENYGKLLQWSARTFVEINKEQTQVPSDLIKLISYSAMGDLSPTSLAAKILIDLNNVKLGPLSHVFSTRPFMKKNRVGGRPVKIGMVTDELQKLLNKDNQYDIKLSNVYHSFSESAWRDLDKGKPENIISEGKKIVSQYFYFVQKNFSEDWDSRNSLIFSSKYIGAFCRLLIDFKRLKLNDTQINSYLARLKQNICKNITLGNEGEVLLKSKLKNGAPQVGGNNSASLVAIYEWLKIHSKI